MKTNRLKINYTFLTSLLLALFFSTTACKKEAQVKAAEDNIINRAFPSADFNVGIASGANYYYEMGFKFSVTQPGKVTKMGVKTPDIGTYRVTLWDADTKSVIATASCNHQNATTFTTVAIGQTPLLPSKNYYITFRTLNQNRYSIEPKTGSKINYPIALGSIVISEYGYAATPASTNNGNTPSYPNYFETTFARGFPEFEFQPD